MICGVAYSNDGKYIATASDDRSTLYVPTCNLLVRRTVYESIEGIREDLRVGEDVDFCWRMRHNGHRLLYVPYGSVKHKHRNDLRRMLQRRAEYGTSEALLYDLHREKKKTFQVPPLAAITFLAVCAAALLVSPFPVLVALMAFLVDCGAKMRKLAKAPPAVGWREVVFSVSRTYLSFFHVASFHIVRYYLVVLVLLGLFFPPVWFLCLFMVLLASVVDYGVKKPKLSFVSFLAYYVLEHVSYQLGVFVGCLRLRTFGSYSVTFVKRML